MIQIDKKVICRAFKLYTDKYDASDEKIKLKIDHTYRVADFSEQIANSIGLDAYDTALAWTIGMLHDIGRFEQVRRYGTFMDAESVDHANFGADLLFKDQLIDFFFPEEDKLKPEFALIELAIRQHNRYRVEDGISERELLFCNIIRDADKIDIFRVNVETPIEAIYNVSTEELKSAPVAEAVMQSFFEEHCILRSLRQSAVDNIVGHISLVYELNFPISLSMVKEQGYIEKLMSFSSNNPLTQSQFEQIRNKMHLYLQTKN